MLPGCECLDLDQVSHTFTLSASSLVVLCMHVEV